MAAMGKDRIARLVEQLTAEVEKLPPEKAALMSHEIVEAWAQSALPLANLRIASLRRTLDTGWTQVDLANLLDVSRQRIHQLLNEQSPTRTRKKQS